MPRGKLALGQNSTEIMSSDKSDSSPMFLRIQTELMQWNATFLRIQTDIYIAIWIPLEHHWRRKEMSKLADLSFTYKKKKKETHTHTSWTLRGGLYSLANVFFCLETLKSKRRC